MNFLWQIDMEFEWQNTSCEGNFITDFPPKVEILFKQAEISKENYMQDAAAAARSSNEGKLFFEIYSGSFVKIKAAD